MKYLLLAPTLVIALSLFPACAKKKTPATPEPTPPQPIVQPSLAPEYSTSCRQTSLNSSQIDILQSNAQRVHMATKLFESPSCEATKLVSIQEIDSNFKLGAKKRDKIFELDLRENEVRFTPMTVEMAETYNRTVFCGITDWKFNEYRVIDKSSGCLGRNDTVNQRTLYTIMSIDGDKIQLGRDSGTGDDGSIPERRHNTLQSVVYVRTGSSVILPPVDESCPNLVGAYRCTQGDALFAGKDASVSTSTDINGVSSIRFDLTQAGTRPSTQVYLPGQPERVVNDGGFEIRRVDLCQGGKLISRVVNFRDGDTANKTLVERDFRLVDTRTLMINTKTTNVVNNRPERTENVRTDCVKVQ